MPFHHFALHTPAEDRQGMVPLAMYRKKRSEARLDSTHSPENHGMERLEMFLTVA
jgi:hypothetical protein